MYESSLEANGNGQTVLYCFYDRRLKDWDQVIDRALNKHKLRKGEATVICLPRKDKE